MNNDDENIRTWIDDGDRVQSRISNELRGIAFARNKKGQWLVRWDDGACDIVHTDFLAREGV